jgi:hypothetical protein
MTPGILIIHGSSYKIEAELHYEIGPCTKSLRSSVAEPDDFCPDPDITKFVGYFSLDFFFAEICSLYLVQEAKSYITWISAVFMLFINAKTVKTGSRRDMDPTTTRFGSAGPESATLPLGY